MLSQEIMKYGDRKSRYFSNESGTLIAVRCAFSHFIGDIEPSDFLRVALNIGGGGVVTEFRGKEQVTRNWKKGSIYISSSEPCKIDCPPVEVLAVAINLAAWNQQGICHYSHADFRYAIEHPPSDLLVSSVLKALWESAQLYGVDTDFFQAGCLQVLARLSQLELCEGTKVVNQAISKEALLVIDNFIDQRMEQRITIAQLAQSIHMDEARFARVFPQTVGQTPFAYLTTKRILCAQRMLISGNDITSTSIAVGYSNPSKFAAAFRRYTGKSPSEWKRSTGI